MKVLILSDSHGDSGVVRTLIERYKHKVQTVVHLGDNVKDLMQFDPDYPGINFVAVAGNCDFYGGLPKERILTVGGGNKKVLLLHGHNIGVKSGLDRLMYYAQEKEVDACLFGHTHMPFVHVHEPVFLVDEEEITRSCFFMNPGSVSEPRGGSRAAYGILTIDGEGNITGEVLEI